MQSAEIYELTNDEAELLEATESCIGLVVVHENQEYKFWLFDDGRCEIASARSVMRQKGLTKRLRPKINYVELYNLEGDLNDLDALKGMPMHFADTELFDVPPEEVPVSDPKVPTSQWALIDTVAIWWSREYRDFREYRDDRGSKKSNLNALLQ